MDRSREAPNARYVEAYRDLAAAFPDGLEGREDAVPIHIGGVDMFILMVGPRENFPKDKREFVEVNLMLEDANYARTGFALFNDGTLLEDDGFIPESDKWGIEKEPDFSGMKIDDIADAVIARLREKAGTEKKETEARAAGQKGEVERAVRGELDSVEETT